MVLTVQRDQRLEAEEVVPHLESRELTMSAVMPLHTDLDCSTVWLTVAS
jgi:hypothetical protein